MRLSSFLAALFLSIASIHIATAEQSQLPQAIEDLQQSASSKSGITFDHSMLVLASKLDPDNSDLRRVIAGIDGLIVRTYHFSGTSQYDPAILTSVDENFRSAGWKRVVNSGDKTQPESLTDVWVRTENKTITNVALLIARPKEVSFIAVSGSISPIDLFHLCGHFGIPNVDAGIEVPKPQHP